MTKYEWESELKKNIHRLPADEISRVLDYYNELFEDHIERGKNEREIINEFGNPSDIADKILSEYDGELVSTDTSKTADESTLNKRKDEQPVYDGIFEGYENNKSEDSAKSDKTSEPKTNDSANVVLSETDKRNFKVALFLILNIVTGFAFVIMAAVAWIVLAAFIVAGFAVSIGGLYAVVISFGPMFGGALGSGLAHLGIGIAAIGLGNVIVALCISAVKLYARLTKALYKYIFCINKKETA